MPEGGGRRMFWTYRCKPPQNCWKPLETSFLLESGQNHGITSFLGVIWLYVCVYIYTYCMERNPVKTRFRILGRANISRRSHIIEISHISHCNHVRLMNEHKSALCTESHILKASFRIMICLNTHPHTHTHTHTHIDTLYIYIYTYIYIYIYIDLEWR